MPGSFGYRDAVTGWKPIPLPFVKIMAPTDPDELLEACLDRLIERGPIEEVSQLIELMPAADPATRQFALTELIKLNMAMAAEGGQPHGIDRYTGGNWPLIAVEDVPLDLVLEEIQLRREPGHCPPMEVYHRHYPHLAAGLGRMGFDVQSTASTARRGPPPELANASIVDDFRIVRKLGQGAFAHVYLAEQVSMRRLVALKVSRGRGDESRTLAQLDHINVVRVFDQREVADDQLHLLYMQFVPGGTLSDVVKSRRQLEHSTGGECLLRCVDQNLLHNAQLVPERSAVRDWIASASWSTVVAWVGMQLAAALQESHGCGVLHRDVKPANVLLSAEGIPKLADFNVSFAGAAGRAGACQLFGGSIGYMAPEHLDAIGGRNPGAEAEVDGMADLYSLAVLLWELWQGHRPFDVTGQSASWSDLVGNQRAARDLPLLPPQRVGDAPERVLEKTLRRALQPDRSGRFSSGAQMAGRLRLALHPEVANLFDPDERSMPAWIFRRSPWLVGLIVLLLPNIAAGAFNFQYNHDEVLDGQIRESLSRVSWWVNSTFFPMGAVLTLWFTWGVVSALSRLRTGGTISPVDLTDAVQFGNRGALIGGSLWMIAGVLFPIVLSIRHDDFTSTQAAQLFISSLICGGVAKIYPYFGMTWIATRVYYPQLVRPRSPTVQNCLGVGF